MDLKKRLPEIIERCCRIKARLSEKDEFAEGQRMLLDFGNTIGHALEGYNRYDDTVRHGEALSIGMYLITRQSEKIGVRGGSVSVSNDAVQGGRSPRIYGLSLHIHQAYAYLMNSKEKFPHLLRQRPITEPSRISICSSVSAIGLFLV